jgi:hypothetical protein
VGTEDRKGEAASRGRVIETARYHCGHWSQALEGDWEPSRSVRYRFLPVGRTGVFIPLLPEVTS